MSARFVALNLWLRIASKPTISRIKRPDDARNALIKRVSRFPNPPEGAYFNQSRIPTSWGNLPIESVSFGRADRHSIILYLHGGAYVTGSPQTHRSISWVLAKETKMRVIVPDYRLAPENKFPSALLDCFDTYKYLLQTGYKADRIVLAGDSAGGGLCFALLQYLEKQKLPKPACVVAFSPWVDLTLSEISQKLIGNSDILLPKHRLRQIVDYYLADTNRDHPLASPIFGQYNDPPPCFIQSGMNEGFAPDVKKLGDKLRQSGSDISIEFWKRAPHAFQFYAPIVPESMKALLKAATFIKNQLPVE